MRLLLLLMSLKGLVEDLQIFLLNCLTDRGLKVYGHKPPRVCSKLHERGAQAAKEMKIVRKEALRREVLYAQLEGRQSGKHPVDTERAVIQSTKSCQLLDVNFDEDDAFLGLRRRGRWRVRRQEIIEGKECLVGIKLDIVAWLLVLDGGEVQRQSCWTIMGLAMGVKAVHLLLFERTMDAVMVGMLLLLLCWLAMILARLVEVALWRHGARRAMRIPVRKRRPFVPIGFQR